MVPWVLFVFVIVAVSAEPEKTRETKSVDADTAESGFFPTYGGFAPVSFVFIFEI